MLIKTNMKTLQQNIMRRVYYAYALNVFMRPSLLHGMALSIGLGVFAAQVHVASVYHNLLLVELGSVPQFLLNAVLRGEVLTLLAIGIIVFTILSTSWQLRGPLFHRSHAGAH